VPRRGHLPPRVVIGSLGDRAHLETRDPAAPDDFRQAVVWLENLRFLDAEPRLPETLQQTVQNLYAALEAVVQQARWLP
jgi:hypothetical protein